MGYSLYYTLNNIVKNNYLDNPVDINNLINKIENSDQEKRNAIFLLIVEHYYHTHPNLNIDPINFSFPYDLKIINDNDITFDIKNIPTELIYIINKFVNIQ